MSYYRHKRRRSRSHSRSSTNKRESQQNRRIDSYEQHHHSIPSNRQYNSHYLMGLNVSIDEIISHTEEYPPVMQSLVRELLLEQKERKLMEERLNLCEHDYGLLRAQHEQTINSFTLLKRDFDQCRMELDESRRRNCQYRSEIDHLLNNERQQMYINDEISYAKRQRRH